MLQRFHNEIMRHCNLPRGELRHVDDNVAGCVFYARFSYIMIWV